MMFRTSIGFGQLSDVYEYADNSRWNAQIPEYDVYWAEKIGSSIHDNFPRKVKSSNILALSETFCCVARKLLCFTSEVGARVVSYHECYAQEKLGTLC